MKPPGVAQIHREICARENCKFRKRLNFEDPCAFCPNGHWGRYDLTLCKDRPNPQRTLGDQIAAIAQPIARLIDKLSGHRTKIDDCGGCNQMKSDLNAGMPISQAIRKRFRPHPKK